MYQLKELRVRARLAQLLDHPERDARAAVHSHAGRLIDHQQMRIFMEDRELSGRHSSRRFCLLSDPKRRNAHQIAEFEAIFRIDASFVHPHLAGAQDAVDMALGHALGQAHQEIVDALALSVLADLDIGDGFSVECVAHGFLNAAIKWMA